MSTENKEIEPKQMSEEPIKKEKFNLKRVLKLVIPLTAIAAVVWFAAPQLKSKKSSECGGHSGCETKTTATKKSTGEGSIVALVNDVVIPRKSLERALKDQAKSADSTKTVTDSTVLNNLIDVELLFQEAQKSGVKLDPRAADIRVDMIARRFADTTAFLNQLKENNLTIEEYRQEWFKQATIDMYISEKIEATVVVKETHLKKIYNRLKKVQSGEKGDARSFESMKEELRTTFVKQKTKMLVDQKLAELRKTSKINYL